MMEHCGHSAGREIYGAPRYGHIGFRLALRYFNQAPADLNSTAPLTIAENQPVGEIVGEFNATDPEGEAITYSLTEGREILGWDENRSLPREMCCNTRERCGG